MKRFLDWIERTGNRLPDPFIIFFGLSVMILILSWALAKLGLSAIHPGDGSIITVTNLLSRPGLQKIMTEMVKNFATFPPFAVVLVTILGIGVADRSGLITAALKKLVTVAPSSLLPATLVFGGVMSNIASDAGYIVLTPLGAILFAAFGRHPIAGLTAAFAGVSGGFSANLFLSSLDPLLSGLSTKAAHLLDPKYTVLPTANYYFMLVSTLVITLVGTFVTVKVIEPRLGPWKSDASTSDDSMRHLSPEERKGLSAAGIFSIFFLGLILAMTLPKNAILRNDAGDLKPFYDSIVPQITLFFMGAGIVFGIRAKTIRSDKDIGKMMAESMAGLGSYIVLAFVASQFVAFFSWSNIGIFTAIQGAAGLKQIGLTGMPLLMVFILLTAFLNLFMGSASAKWAIMAPVFVPLLMMLGYSPEVAQNSYRIGDSVTNIISPLLPYFPIIVAFGRKYRPDLGVGTLISLMLPYSISFLIAWSLLFAAWFMLGIPTGPEAPLFYHLPGQ